MKTAIILIVGMCLGIFLIFFGPTIIAAIAFIVATLGTVIAFLFQVGMYILAGAFFCFIVYGVFGCVFNKNKK